MNSNDGMISVRYSGLLGSFKLDVALRDPGARHYRLVWTFAMSFGAYDFLENFARRYLPRVRKDPWQMSVKRLMRIQSTPTITSLALMTA
jgi:hypothetical protein